MSNQSLVPAKFKKLLREEPEKFFIDLDIKLGLSTRLQTDEGIEILDKSRFDEIKERLADLGYKREDLESGDADDPFGLKGPLREFQKELGIKPSGVLTPKTEKTLARFVEWEGETEDLRLPADLNPGSRGVFVRALQYRLKTLGFYHSIVDGEYGSQTRLAVISFKKAFGDPFKADSAGGVDRKLFMLLSNPYTLNTAMVARLNSQPVIFKLLTKNGREDKKCDPSRVFIARGVFRIAGKDTCTEVSGLCEPMQPIHELIEHIRPNREAVHLLQLWLWMMNIYQGRLDGIFGPESFRAFLQYLMENSLERKNYIIELQNDYIAICPAIFFELGAKTHGIEEIEKHEKYILGELENILAHEERVQESRGFFSKLQKEVVSTVIRIYQGSKSIIVRVGKSIARGAKWVWEKAKKLGGTAMHLMSLALARVRKSLSVFWKSLRDFYHFLEHRTIVTGSRDAGCISIFQKDFDLVTVYSSSNSADLIVRHGENVKMITYIFSVACKVVGIAISTVVNALKGPVGWIQIAIILARELYGVVKEQRMGGPSYLALMSGS